MAKLRVTNMFTNPGTPWTGGRIFVEVAPGWTDGINRFPGLIEGVYNPGTNEWNDLAGGPLYLPGADIGSSVEPPNVEISGYLETTISSVVRRVDFGQEGTPWRIQISASSAGVWDFNTNGVPPVIVTTPGLPAAQVTMADLRAEIAAQKNQVNGLAGLGNDGKVLPSQLPAPTPNVNTGTITGAISIPASNATAVPVVVNPESYPVAIGTSATVSVKDVSVKLEHLALNSWQLTRITTAGAATPVEAGTSFFPGVNDGGLTPRVTDLEKTRDKIVYPLKPASRLNAMLKRNMRAMGEFNVPQWLKGSSVAFVGTPKTEAVFSQAALDSFGDYNTVRFTAQIGSSAFSALSATITKAELNAAGILENDTIGSATAFSLRVAILKSSLVNLNSADIIAGNTAGSVQVWVSGRYGPNASNVYFALATELAWFNAGTTPVFNGVNNTTFNNAGTRTDDGTFVILTKNGMKLPATQGGQPLTALKIHVIPRPTAFGSPFSLEVCGVAVVAGVTIGTYTAYQNSDDAVLPLVVAADLDPALAAGLTSNAYTVNAATSDTLRVFGNSRNSGGWQMVNKAPVVLLGALGPYRVKNFSYSGENARDIAARIRANAAPFGTLGVQNSKTSIGLIMEFTNSDSMSQSDRTRYLSDMAGLVVQIKQLRALPVIATELGNTRSGNGSAAKELKVLANRLNVPFVNLVDDATKFFDGFQGYMGGVHEGTRTVWWMVDPLKRWMDTLERPEKSLKIFTKNPNFTMGSTADLLYEHGNYAARAQRFTEAPVGHYGLQAGAKEQGFDALNTIGTLATDKINDLYDELELGNPITFTADYVWLEVILPHSENSVLNLKLSDPTIVVSVRDFLSGAYETNTRYIGFKTTDDLSTLAINAVYTSSDNGVGAIPGNLTVAYIPTGPASGYVHMTPATASTTQNRSAGTLTKVSGSGPATINYSAAEQTGTQSWYDQAGKPEGNLIALTGSAGVWALDPKKHVAYDEVHILLFKSGGMTLSNISIEGIGSGGKIRTRKPALARPTGAELFAEPFMGDTTQLATWTKSSGAVVVAQPEELSATPPSTAALPTGAIGITRIPADEWIEKTINFVAADYVRTLQVDFWSRRYIPAWGGGAIAGSAIRRDTWDTSDVEIIVFRAGALQPASVKTYVSPAFGRRIAEFDIPTGDTQAIVRFRAVDKTLEGAKASAKLLA
jgi:hypothetical protein